MASSMRLLTPTHARLLDRMQGAVGIPNHEGSRQQLGPVRGECTRSIITGNIFRAIKTLGTIRVQFEQLASLDVDAPELVHHDQPEFMPLDVYSIVVLTSFRVDLSSSSGVGPLLMPHSRPDPFVGPDEALLGVAEGVGVTTI